MSERGVRDFGADSMEHIRAIQVVIISANCWGSNLIHPHKKLGGERDREKESWWDSLLIFLYLCVCVLCIRYIGKCCAPSFLLLMAPDENDEPLLYTHNSPCVCVCTVTITIEWWIIRSSTGWLARFFYRRCSTIEKCFDVFFPSCHCAHLMRQQCLHTLLKCLSPAIWGCLFVFFSLRVLARVFGNSHQTYPPTICAAMAV